MKTFLLLFYLTVFSFSIWSQGLVAHYPLNGNASDSSGNGNDGTLNGVTFASNNTITFAQFTSPSYINVPDNSNFDFSNASGVTIVTWIKQEQSTSGDILRKMGTSGASDDEYALWLSPTGQITGAFNGPGQQKTLQAKSSLSLNTWTHVVFMWNKVDSKVSFYINGLLDTTTSSTITSIQNTNAVLRIGAWVQSSLNSFMGSIDDIRIYNRALSDQEILQLYSPAITQGLVAYYPFDGNANDYSTNGNNGTPFGGISWDTDRFGNASSACNFDGTNSYIEIPNSESIQINTNKLTFTLWFNCTGTPQGPAAFFSKTDNPDIPQYTFHLNPFSIIRFGITDTSNVLRYISHPYPFSYNQWYFLAATWDGTTVKIFVNDSLVTTQPFVYIMKSDTNPLEIGKDTGGLTDWYQGKLDDVRIYNRALSQTEIINLVTDVESENSLVTLDKFVLSQNYPNPFNPSTTINFSVPGASNVNITVYDINGQVVSNLLSEFKNSGNYSLNWDGKNDSGSKVSSGTYFYQVQIGNLVQTKKMILLK